MKRKLLLEGCFALTLSFLLLVGFAAHGSAQQTNANHLAANAEMPGFSVKVDLSEKARKELAARNETVVVAGYLSGNPKKGAPKKFVDEMGEVNLGEITKEIAPGEVALFPKVSMKPDALQQIDSDGPQLLINVFSGRRSSKDNLLSCSLHEGPLKDIENTTVGISCKLIDE